MLVLEQLGGIWHVSGGWYVEDFFMNVKRDIKFQSSGNCEDQGGSECDTAGEDEDSETQNGHQRQTSEYIRNCVWARVFMRAASGPISKLL